MLFFSIKNIFLNQCFNNACKLQCNVFINKNQTMKIRFFVISLFFTQLATAQLRLPSFIADNMVLQQKKVNRIWGWAAAKQLVTVEFNAKKYPAIAAADGQWQVFLEESKAGNAGSMIITTENEKITLNNILVGEVWICSGQSNMEMRLASLADLYKDELQSANNDNIRFVTLSHTIAGEPQQDVKLDKKWSAITPATVGDCSAVAYWYAKKIQQQLKVPIGLIVTSWGGTPSQAWTGFEGLHDFPAYSNHFVKDIMPLKLDDINRQRQLLYEKFVQTVKEKYPFIKDAMQPGFDDAGWKEMYLPKPWEQQGYPALDGIVLYRVEFTVDAADAGKEAALSMPAIDDMDSTYINGTFIGSINQYDALRKYKIPAALLKAGKNILTIRVEDGGGGGGLSAVPEQFTITVGSKVISLVGNAKYNVVAPLESITAGSGDIEDQPTLLFNGMIAPLLPLSIRGAIWYQGESNADFSKDAYEYRTLFPAMISDWRNRWGQGQFPFLFVQLAAYGALRNEPVESAWAVLRESQTKTLSLPNTAMAVTTDVGNPKDIHPHRKKEVGERLADGAMKMVYGKTTMLSSGPQYKSYKVQGNKMVLQFENTGTGLLVKGKQLQHFAIAGADKKFVWADAVIVGNTIVVSSKQLLKPVAVRYAWADSPVDANLYNREGYPAVPFRTDDWPLQ
jgi:sialate O-acetylesterase